MDIQKHTVTDPLKLRWDDVTYQYKVNKPNVDGGELVSKDIADELLIALTKLKDYVEMPTLYENAKQEYINIANNAIKNATNK